VEDGTTGSQGAREEAGFNLLEGQYQDENVKLDGWD
jgi:hypothetical protein